MTKFILSALTALATLGTSPAFAKDVNGPLYTCYLSGNVKGRSIAIIVGGQEIKGPGEILCMDAKSGREMTFPVTIKIVGIGVGLDLSVIKAMRVGSAGIGVNDPELFANSFSLGATAGATLINAGVAFDLALKANAKNGFGFEVGLQGKEVEGLGAHLYGMSMKIIPRD